MLPVRGVLGALEVVMGQQNSFDPAGSKRFLRICMTGISQLMLLPTLWEALRTSAPHIRINVLPLSNDPGSQWLRRVITGLMAA